MRRNSSLASFAGSTFKKVSTKHKLELLLRFTPSNFHSLPKCFLWKVANRELRCHFMLKWVNNTNASLLRCPNKYEGEPAGLTSVQRVFFSVGNRQVSELLLVKMLFKPDDEKKRPLSILFCLFAHRCLSGPFAAAVDAPTSCLKS